MRASLDRIDWSKTNSDVHQWYTNDLLFFHPLLYYRPDFEPAAKKLLNTKCEKSSNGRHLMEGIITKSNVWAHIECVNCGKKISEREFPKKA